MSADCYSYYRQSARLHIRNIVERFPPLFLFISNLQLRLKGAALERGVDHRSRLVIEGFPRSANSFAVKAFRFAQGERTRIGNHTHSRANVFRGLKLKLPLLVIIRNPRDAIIGACVFDAQCNGAFEKKRWRYALIKLYAKRYLWFYKPLLPLRSQLICADFSEVVNDFGAVTNALNQKFCTDFVCFDHCSENVEKLFASSPPHLSPSHKRQEMRLVYEKLWDELLGDDLLQSCEDVYREFRK